MFKLKNKMIDCIFILAHPEYEKDRIEYLNNHFKSNHVDIPITFIKPYWKNENIMFKNKYSNCLKESEKCLTQTYLDLFKYIIDKTKYEYVLFLESDVMFQKDFNENLNKIFQEFKNLNLDNSMVFLGDDHLKGKKLDNQVSEHLFEQKWSRCTDSMLMNRSIMKEFLNQTENITINQPIDHLMNELHKTGKFRYFWVEKGLVSQGTWNGIYTSNIK